MKEQKNIRKKDSILAVVGILTVALCAGAMALVMRGHTHASVEVSEPSSQTQSSAEEKDHNGPAVENTIGDIQLKEPTEPLPDTFDPYRYVKQGYELKKYLGVSGFSSADKLPVGPTVQYAFCYLYADGLCLMDFNPGAMLYRSATEAEITDKITELFGSCPIDVKKSDLYSAGKNSFEMWQPNYKDHIFASAVCTALEDGSFRIEATYYESSKNRTPIEQAELVVSPGKNGTYYIRSMK